MPSVSPFATLMLTCCTALTTPRLVANSTVRSLTSSKGCAVMGASRPPLRIDDVAQTVAEQIKAKHRDHQRKTGKQRDPPFARYHEARALRDHDPPLGCRRSHAKPYERQACSIEDRVAHRERHLHDHDRHDVRQDVNEQYPEFTISGKPRRLHEAGVTPHIRLGAGDAGV